jgi:hypothetical protein
MQTIKKNKTFTLTTGQLFQGRITKLFPNHVASLSLNGMKLTARLEAALTVGQRYWFEVKDGKGIPRLKVLDDNSVRHRDGAMLFSERLVQQLGLPQSKGIESFVQQLANKQIPFSKAALSRGIDVLGQLNQLNERGFAILTSMLERQIPISKDTFLALQASDRHLSLTQQLIYLSNQLETVESDIAKKIIELVANVMKSGPVQSTESPITQLLKLFSQNDDRAATLLSRLGIFKETTTLEHVAFTFKSAVLNIQNQSVVEELWPNDTKQLLLHLHPQRLFETYMKNLSIPTGKDGIGQLTQLMQLLPTNLQVEQFSKQWGELQAQVLSTEEKDLIRLLLENSVTTHGAKQGSGGVNSHLQSILSMLGYSHENNIRRFFQGERTKDPLQLESVKALLMKLHEENISTPIKHQVSQALLRLTAQQLMAHEQIGPMHQFFMQIPCSLGQFQTEMTMQWEGHKREDGQLDASYCRILFYLTLERLEGKAENFTGATLSSSKKSFE